MKIICAGLTKTGTTSLAAALRILGFTVHDYPEHIIYHLDEYVHAMDGEMPDFVAMYNNVDATTDGPACFFFEEMKLSFPDAKVILTERENVETWVASRLNHLVMMEKAVGSEAPVWVRLAFLLTPTGRKWMVSFNQDNERLQTSAEEMSKMYVEHNARVKATIRRDELLVFNVKQGWKPLCEFLGVAVPNTPFPRLNVKSGDIADHEKFHNEFFLFKQIFKELVLMTTIFVIFMAILIFMIINWS